MSQFFRLSKKQIEKFRKDLDEQLWGAFADPNWFQQPTPEEARRIFDEFNSGYPRIDEFKKKYKTKPFPFDSAYLRFDRLTGEIIFPPEGVGAIIEMDKQPDGSYKKRGPSEVDIRKARRKRSD